MRQTGWSLGGPEPAALLAASAAQPRPVTSAQVAVHRPASAAGAARGQGSVFASHFSLAEMGGPNDGGAAAARPSRRPAPPSAPSQAAAALASYGEGAAVAQGRVRQTFASSWALT